MADLSAFLAVAEERSFTRAAARLGITQSTLSYTIRSFEGALEAAPLQPHDPQRGAHRGGRAAAPGCQAPPWRPWGQNSRR